jgi:hypothetical protein
MRSEAAQSIKTTFGETVTKVKALRAGGGSALRTELSAQTPAVAGKLTNGSQFETLYEAPISGTSRGAHRAAANRNLLGQLEADSSLRSSMDDLLGADTVAHMKSGSGALRNPPGTAWHHPAGSNDSMILLRSEVHTMPSLQSVLHPGPNGGGGFAEFFG